MTDTFWVNLIGRGYPAPRPKFRWCTERLKIKPSNSFIREMVRSHGEAILVLGTRKAESSGRHARMAKLESRRVRDLLSPNDSLPNALVYSPVENWSNDDVWTFLMQSPNPWGYSNKDLLTMYQGASADGECPLVVDSSTPSCGDSRFGCWTCTLVEKDKSMSAMIQNDEEKEWMLPLLDLRNALDVADDRHLRDFRRMNGSVQLFHDRPIHGPYKQSAREDWLKRLLEAQAWIRENGPEYVRALDLITLPELEEIRRIWVVEKHEFEDHLPGIYEAAMGEPYPGGPLDEHLPLGAGHDRGPARSRGGRPPPLRAGARASRRRAAPPRAGPSRGSVRVAGEGSASWLLRRRGGRDDAGAPAEGALSTARRLRPRTDPRTRSTWPMATSARQRSRPQ